MPFKKNYCPSIVLVILLGLIMMLTACRADDNQEDDAHTIVLAHAMHLTHPVSVAMDEMAKNIETISNGKLKIEIYPTQQLGSERELLELVQIGTIDMTKISAGSLENIVPDMRVFSLPYLFRDEEHMAKVLWGEVGDEILQEGAEYGLMGLDYYDAGSRSLYTKNRRVTNPDDLSGMKVRVMPSAMATKLIKRLGASPTPLAYGELYTAFQGGIVDAAENNPPSFYTSRHYEVCNYYIINEHTTIPDVLVIGTKTWENLTGQQQEWLREAVEQSVELQRKLWRESVKESMEEVQKAGVEVIYPDKTPFRERLQPIYDEFQEEHPDLYKWVERIRNVE